MTILKSLGTAFTLKMTLQVRHRYFNKHYQYHRYRVLIIHPSTRPCWTIPASGFNRRTHRRWRLPVKRKWHLRILLWWLWWPVVLPIHLFRGSIAHGRRSNTAVYPGTCLSWWERTPKVVTSVSRYLFFYDFVGAWIRFRHGWITADYLHWRHTGIYIQLFLSDRTR